MALPSDFEELNTYDHIIIGAGLSGLTLAYKLKKEGLRCIILEARNRLGGRINTVTSAYKTPIDMGATWFGMKHQNLVNLLDEIGINYFEQFMEGTTLFEPISFAPPQKIDVPPNQEPSYRIAGGSSSLIDALANSLQKDQILFNERVQSINQHKDTLIIGTKNRHFKAKKVISTLPPLLLVNTIDFSPALPKELLNVARHTDIWMGDSIKCGVSYASPFWKEVNYSGAAFSNVGPFTELYDHSDYENEKFALKGFLQPGMHKQPKKTRKKQVVEQLVKFFGDPAKDFLAYKEQLWREEPATFVESPDFIAPHSNNGHQLYSKSFFDDRLLLAGAETSANFGGYMEGAISSAYRSFTHLTEQ